MGSIGILDQDRLPYKDERETIMSRTGSGGVIHSYIIECVKLLAGRTNLIHFSWRMYGE